jgi:hypothetical protein
MYNPNFVIGASLLQLPMKTNHATCKIRKLYKLIVPCYKKNIFHSDYLILHIILLLPLSG